MTDQPALRLAIVEDHALVRAAVRHALESEPGLLVVAEASTAEEAMVVIPPSEPDVALIDIDLPGMRGIELVRELAPRYPDLWCVMLTISRSERDLLDALRSGARGFIRKDLSPDALVRSIRDIRNGVMPLSRLDASIAIARLSEASGRQRAIGPGMLAELTARENEVLALLADGLTDRQISVALAISRRTVETHVRNILAKLSVESRLAAARRFTLRNPLRDPGG